MKLVSYLNDGRDQFAILVDGLVYNADLVHMELPSSMGMFLNYWEDLYPSALSANQAIIDGHVSKAKGIPIEEVELLSPIPFPSSCRDAYAFRQHVAIVRRNSGAAMIPEFDQ